MRRKHLRALFLISLLIVLALAFLLVNNIDLRFAGRAFERRGLRLGLDLQGGTHLVLQPDLSKVAPEDRGGQVKAVIDIIERRINAFGVVEPNIQLLGTDRIIVQLPGVRDINEAVSLIKKTAFLDFREPKLDEKGQIVKDDLGLRVWVPAMAEGNDGKLKQLTGQYLGSNAAVVLDPTTNEPQVSLEFNGEGAKLFEEITGRLYDPNPNLQKPLAIYLDDQLISYPIVRARISGGRAVIENIGSLQEARTLAIQLNAGAFPVPVEVIQQQDVDPTLGRDSIRRSLIAGEAGLGLVVLFMVLFYRFPGFLASIALAIYATLVLAVFKFIPITLTMAGIAGFILSIGMAVDANVLIFERLKEELRAGRSLGTAIENGFDRAWTSIRDSNISTLITCGILYWFGNNFGASMVMGFAFTLAIGVGISMFSAITVSRTLLRVFLGVPVFARPSLYIPTGKGSQNA